MQSGDHEMLSYIFKKFLRWSGLRNATELERAEERDMEMRSKYMDTVEYFPDKNRSIVRSIGSSKFDFYSNFLFFEYSISSLM